MASAQLSAAQAKPPAAGAEAGAGEAAAAAAAALYCVVEEGAQALGGKKDSLLERSGKADKKELEHTLLSRGLLSLAADPRAARELLGAAPGARALLLLRAAGQGASAAAAGGAGAGTGAGGAAGGAAAPLAVADVRWVSQFAQQCEFLLSPCALLHLQRQRERPAAGDSGKPSQRGKLADYVELALAPPEGGGGGGGGGVCRGFLAELRPPSPMEGLAAAAARLPSPHSVPGTAEALSWLDQAFSHVYPRGAAQARALALARPALLPTTSRPPLFDLRSAPISAQALKEDELLELPHASLTDEQAELVGLLAGRAARTVAPRLHSLVLKGCHLTGSGLKRLAATLACDAPGTTAQLTSINLFGVLAKCLDSKQVLERSAGGEALGALVRRTPTLTSIVAGGHPLKAAGVKALAEAVGAHPALTELNLQEAGLDDGAVKELAAAMHESRPLRRLDVRHNGLDKGLTDQLKQVRAPLIPCDLPQSPHVLSSFGDLLPPISRRRRTRRSKSARRRPRRAEVPPRRSSCYSSRRSRARPRGAAAPAATARAARRIRSRPCAGLHHKRARTSASRQTRARRSRADGPICARVRRSFAVSR